MPQLIRCIHVGVHRRGEKILRGFMSLKDACTPVALVDATPELARQHASLAGVPEAHCFTTLAEAIRAVKADAVVITSPARLHAQQVTESLLANLHVYVAKPLCYDLDESIGAVELAARKKRVLLVDQQQRFSTTEIELAAMVRDQRYGPLGFAAFSVHRYRPEMAAFTSDNPFVWEQGVHSFDSMLAIFQRPALAVQAIQSKPPWSVYNGPTVSMGQIEFGGGLLCSYLGTFESRSFTMELRLEFEKCAVRAIANDSWFKTLEIAEPGGKFAPLGVGDALTGALESANIEAFHRGCTSGGVQVNEGLENLRTLALTDAFIRSARSGKREWVRTLEI